MTVQKSFSPIVFALSALVPSAELLADGYERTGGDGTWHDGNFTHLFSGPLDQRYLDNRARTTMEADVTADEIFVGYEDASAYAEPTTTLQIGSETNTAIAPNFQSGTAYIGNWPQSDGQVDFFRGTWTNTGNLLVGWQGKGVLNLLNDASLGTDYLRVGDYNSASDSRLSLHDQSSLSVTGTSNTIIGDLGYGSLEISDSASFETTDNLSLGVATNLDQTVFGAGVIEMTGGSLSVGQNLNVGWEGDGEVLMSGTSTATVSQDLVVGSGTLSQASLLLENEARLDVTGQFNMSRHSTDSLTTLKNNAIFNTGTSRIGESNPASNGSILLNGGTWNNAGLTDLGHQGTGTLSVESGALMTSHSLYAGVQASGRGEIFINGSGRVEIADTLSLGRGDTSHGTLEMTGGTLTTYNAYLGTFASSSGSAVLRGNSQWTNGNQISLGYSTDTTNTLEVREGATLNTHRLMIGDGASSTGEVTLRQNGSIQITDGNAPAVYVAFTGNGTFNIADAGVVDFSQTSNPGVFSIGQDSNAVGEVNMIEGRVLNGGGETRVGAWGTGTLNMQMNARFEAGDLIVGQDSGSSGTLNLQQGSTLVVDSLRTHASSTSQINLDSGSTIAIQSGTQDLFENFKQGEIDITNGAVLDTSTHDVSTASNFGGFSGTGVLSKEGNGSLTLHGESTHLGTLVDAGSLIVEGEVTGFVTVSAGATVGGSGVTGDMTLTDAHLAPGSSPGEITVASLSFNGDNTIAFELGIGAAQSDLISVLGAIESDGGEILFNFLDNGWVDDQTYDLINFGSSTIDLADYAYSSGDSDFGGTFSQSGNTLQFTTQFIPEPSSTLLLALAGGSLLTRRRPLSPRQKTCVPHKRHQPPLRAGVPLFPKS